MIDANKPIKLYHHDSPEYKVHARILTVINNNEFPYVVLYQDGIGGEFTELFDNDGLRMDYGDCENHITNVDSYKNKIKEPTQHKVCITNLTTGDKINSIAFEQKNKRCPYVVIIPAKFLDNNEDVIEWFRPDATSKYDDENLLKITTELI